MKLKKRLLNFFCLPLVQFVLRLLFGAIFIYASISKILNPVDFAETVYNYKLLPPGFVGAVSLLLPWIELVCGISLIFGLLKKASALILSVLLMVFIVAIGINLLRGRIFNCGCFSAAKLASLTESGYWLIFRDMLFLIPGFIILWFETEKEKSSARGND
jgi:uncharacterized membrane protein YphA (DoxX/SURF4 family)